MELLDCNKREVINDATLDKDHIFAYFGSSSRFMLGRSGFMIVDEIRGDDALEYLIHFQARHFTQERLGEDRYLFTNKENSEVYECVTDLHLEDSSQNDLHEFEVVEKEYSIREYFSYIIDPLLRLMDASKATGNPIHWT